jgi:hypothetical protein
MISSSSITLSQTNEPNFHPYRLSPPADASTEGIEAEWINGDELKHATELVRQREVPLKFLVLYGSLRQK